MKTKDMAYIALMAVLISVCSWLSVPAAIPFTMQTYAVFTALLLLGGRRGSIAVAVYIALGAVGLPVFSGFAGGIGKLMGPSGGYIFGFMLTALCYWLCERVLGKKLWVRIVSLVVGLALCYAFGTVWFVVLYVRNTGPIGVWSVLLRCVIPFLLPDLVKILLAVRLSGLIRARLSHGKT